MSHQRIWLLLLVLLFLSMGQAIAGDFTFIYIPHGRVRHLPRCPAGCAVHSFRRPGTFVGDITHKRDWSKLLRSIGAQFPEGGFVVYERSTGTIRIASTPADFDIITPLE